MRHVQYDALLTGSGRDPGGILPAFSLLLFQFCLGEQSLGTKQNGFSSRENSSGINNAAFMNYADISLPSLPGFEAQSSVVLRTTLLHRAALSWQVVLLSSKMLACNVSAVLFILLSLRSTTPRDDEKPAACVSLAVTQTLCLLSFLALFAD